MARKLIYTVLGIFGLFIVSALLIPFFVDLNAYKTEISEKAKETLGRDLTLEGPIKLSLLPSPSVTVEKVSLSNIPGGQAPTMLSLDKVRVDIALMPLLKRKLQVTNIHLLKPLIHLEKLPDGSNNWTFEALAAPSDEASGDVSAPQEESDFSFSFDRIEIINADIFYHEGKTQHEIKSLTTQLKIDDLKGPFEAEGFLKAMNQDIRFELKVKELGEKIPVKLELDSLGVEVELEGDFNQEKASFQGDLKISGDVKSIEKATQNKIDLPAFLGDKVSLSGYVKANDKSVDIENLTLKADEEKLKGKLSARFTPLTFSGTLRGFPGHLALQFSGTPQKSGLSGQAEISLSSPKDFFRWMDKSWPKEIGNGRLQLQASFHQNGDLIKLSSFSGGVNEASLSGSASYNAQNRTAHYNVKAEGLAPLIKAFGGDEPPLNLSTLALKGQTSFDKEVKHLKTKTDLSLPGGSLSLEGPITLHEKEMPSFDLQTSLSVTNPQALLKSSAFKSLKVNTRLKQAEKKISAESLKGTIGVGRGSVSVSGGTKISLSGTPKITGDFVFDTIHLSKLFPETKDPKHAKIASSAASAKAAKNEASFTWSSDPIDLSFLKNFGADLSFSAPLITWEDHSLKNLSGKASLEKGLLQMPALTGDIYGGKLNIGMSVDGGKTSTIKVRASLDDLSLKRALSKTKDNKIRLAQGELDGLVNLTTTGGSQKEFASALEGLVNLKTIKGIVDGFDLQSISQKLKNLNTLDAFLNLFKTAMSSGQTNFSDFSLAIAFKKGVGEINKLVLIAEGGEGQGSGTIDLPKYALSVSTEFRLTDHDSLPPFKMAIHGPLDNPQKDFDTSGLEAHLAKNVFTKLLGGVVAGGPIGVVAADLLGNLTGGGSDSDNKKDSKASGQTQKKESASHPAEDVVKAPAKAVENLIKGLF